VSIPHSPFNTFAFFKGESFSASSNPQTIYQNRLDSIREQISDCNPIDEPRGSVQPWELPQNEGEFLPLNPEEQYCQQCFDEYGEETTYSNPDGFKRKVCNEINWYTTKENCEAGPVPDDSGDYRNYSYEWVSKECRFLYKNHLLYERQENPAPIPSGWRVTSSGHLTNLPVDLDVSDKTDALKNGVYVVSPTAVNYQYENGHWTTKEFTTPILDSAVKTNPTPYNVVHEFRGSPQHLWSISYPCRFKEIEDTQLAKDYNILTEQDCANMDYTLMTYSPSNTTFGTLRAVIDKAKGENKLNKFYWWVESPLFSAACPETVTPANAAGKYDYWDKTQCKKSNSNSNDEPDSVAQPIILIAGVASIVAATFFFKGGGV